MMIKKYIHLHSFEKMHLEGEFGGTFSILGGLQNFLNI